jgi:putative ABC transport system permease protein
MTGDLRYALRHLSRSPAFTAAVIATLALGIGANVAMFSVADAVLLRPLPFPDADRLVVIWDQLTKIGVLQLQVSLENFEVYRSDTSLFDAAAIFREEDRNLTGAGAAERVSVVSAMPALFDMVGARLAFGRKFSAQEGAGSAILSYPLFIRRFGSNPAIVGQTIRLDDRAYTVAGVMAPDFDFSLRPASADVWTPLPPVTDRGSRFGVLARMRPGIGIEAARASVMAAATHIENMRHPYRGPNGEDPGYRATVVSLHDQLLGDLRKGTLMLMSAVALVLLIACVNVANLLLARAAARQGEMAVRRSLGATGTRLVRQSMVESALLATLGGIAGLVVSGWAVSLVRALSPIDVPGIARIGIDARAMIFALAISAVVCVLFGVAPALAAVRMSGGLRGSRATRRPARLLVTVEVALSLFLLIGAGLLLKSFTRLRHIDPGFEATHLLTMQLQLSGTRYQEPHRRIAFFSGLQERLAALPGVVSASMVSRLPVARAGLNTRSGNPFSIEGRPWNPNGSIPQIAHTQTAGPGYFRTFGIPLLSGRDFSGSDTMDAPHVALINETLARGFFPRGDAIGQRILLGAPQPGARWMTIIGIIADLKSGAIDEAPMPQFYTPLAQDAPASMVLTLRTAGDPMRLAREAASMVRSIDPDQPVYNVSTMERRVEEAFARPRFQTVLLSLFAGAALFLAAVGIYGVMAHAAVQRTREIGIRMALGADARRMITAVLAEALQPVTFGMALGIAGAAALARLLAGMLFEVQPRDPAMFAAAAAVLAAVAAAACFIPARRAALLNPAAALRQD